MGAWGCPFFKFFTERCCYSSPPYEENSLGPHSFSAGREKKKCGWMLPCCHAAAAAPCHPPPTQPCLLSVGRFGFLGHYTYDSSTAVIAISRTDCCERASTARGKRRDASFIILSLYFYRSAVLQQQTTAQQVPLGHCPILLLGAVCLWVLSIGNICATLPRRGARTQRYLAYKYRERREERG